MTWFDTYRQLKNCFELNSDEIDIPESNLVIRNFSFQSTLSDELNFSTEDRGISENFQFRYPVIMKKNRPRHEKAIILLHGLNERTWLKHLAGAKMLVEQTNRPVLLFPLSFHINRGLPDWIDLRKMARPLAERQSQYTGVKESSLVNLALSKRLTDSPDRFLLSGLQSINDLTALIKSIKSGKHPLFKENATTDIFAYSISCMLLQALMISNPNSILSGSRIVLFAGGSVFEQINGVSKYIMDTVAFATMRKYYLDLITTSKNFYLKGLRPMVMESNLGLAFRSLLTSDRMKNTRLKGISAFYKDLLIISLRNDRVMPVNGIVEATGEKFLKTGRFKVLHFPYEYSHENPFPVLNEKLEKQVEKAFYSVYDPALRFFRRD